jgi:predicted negative regulator of RcsB-dependent stress response
LDPYQQDDDVERLKAWWKNYGNALILGIVLGSGLLGGYTYWRHYQARQAEAASEIYAQLLEAHQRKDLAAVRAGAERLTGDYAGTPYAGKAALFLARLSFDAGDPATTRRHLEWALERAREETTRRMALLRLARLSLLEGDADGALRLLDGKGPNGFESEYEELRGDALAAKGRKDPARAAYQAALAHLPKGSPYASILQMKLDDLGPESRS